MGGFLGSGALRQNLATTNHDQPVLDVDPIESAKDGLVVKHRAQQDIRCPVVMSSS